jgi:hypothetical protein
MFTKDRCAPSGKQSGPAPTLNTVDPQLPDDEPRTDDDLTVFRNLMLEDAKTQNFEREIIVLSDEADVWNQVNAMLMILPQVSPHCMTFTVVPNLNFKNGDNPLFARLSRAVQVYPECKQFEATLSNFISSYHATVGSRVWQRLKHQLKSLSRDAGFSFVQDIDVKMPALVCAVVWDVIVTEYGLPRLVNSTWDVEDRVDGVRHAALEALNVILTSTSEIDQEKLKQTLGIQTATFLLSFKHAYPGAFHTRVLPEQWKSHINSTGRRGVSLKFWEEFKKDTDLYAVWLASLLASHQEASLPANDSARRDAWREAISRGQVKLIQRGRLALVEESRRRKLGKLAPLTYEGTVQDRTDQMLKVAERRVQLSQGQHMEMLELVRESTVLAGNLMDQMPSNVRARNVAPILLSLVESVHGYHSMTSFCLQVYEHDENIAFQYMKDNDDVQLAAQRGYTDKYTIESKVTPYYAYNAKPVANMHDCKAHLEDDDKWMEQIQKCLILGVYKNYFCVKLPCGDQLAFLSVMPHSSGEEAFLHQTWGMGPGRPSRLFTSTETATPREMEHMWNFMFLLTQATQDCGGLSRVPLLARVRTDQLTRLQSLASDTNLDRGEDCIVSVTQRLVRREPRILGGHPTYDLWCFEEAVAARLRFVHYGAIVTVGPKQRSSRWSRHRNALHEKKTDVHEDAVEKHQKQETPEDRLIEEAYLMEDVFGEVQDADDSCKSRN